MNYQEVTTLVHTYSPEERDKFVKQGDVTPNGVAFDWWLASIDGAGFCLVAEPHHTRADLHEAEAYIRRQRDVVSFYVGQLEKGGA